MAQDAARFLGVCEMALTGPGFSDELLHDVRIQHTCLQIMQPRKTFRQKFDTNEPGDWYTDKRNKVVPTAI